MTAVSNYAGFQCTATALYVHITVCSVNPTLLKAETIDYIVQNGHQINHQLWYHNQTIQNQDFSDMRNASLCTAKSVEIHRYANFLNGVLNIKKKMTHKKQICYTATYDNQ